MESGNIQATERKPAKIKDSPKVTRGRMTKRDIDAHRCKPGQERDYLWCGELKGFGVLAMKSGRKIFIFQYRQHGKLRRIRIGDYGAMMLEDSKAADGRRIEGARTRAERLRTAVREGKDPLQELHDKKAVRTFKEVAEQFLSDHVDAKRKPHTANSYRRVFDLHILPAIGSRPVNEVTKDQVMRLHHKMKDKPSAANRCLSRDFLIVELGCGVGEVNAQDNPARIKRSRRYPEKPKERFLSPDELANLGDALRRAETVGIPWTVDETKLTAKHARKVENRIRLIDAHAVAALRLLILTGARLREVLHAKWDYVNFERGIMLLPDSKTGKKAIYLSAAALAVLNAIPHVPGNPYIIPGEKRPKKRGEPKPAPAPRADLKRPWAAVSKAAGLTNVRIHDLRHSFASMGAGASLGLPIIGKLLGHTQAATTQRYSHLDADPMRRAADIIGGQIAAAMAGKSGDVVQLKGFRVKHGE